MKSLGLSRYALAMGAAAALLAGCGEAQPAAHKGVGRGVRINGCVMGTKATIDTPFNVKGAWLSILCGILLAHFYNFGSGLHHCMSWDWAFGNAAATVLYLHQPTILLATIVAAALLYVVAGYATRHMNFRPIPTVAAFTLIATTIALLGFVTTTPTLQGCSPL